MTLLSLILIVIALLVCIAALVGRAPIGVAVLLVIIERLVVVALAYGGGVR